jgi:hypothetical protein
MKLRLNKLFYSRAAILIAIADFKDAGNECMMGEDDNHFIIQTAEPDEFANYVLGLMKNEHAI